jgi:hypothetical protein
VNRLIKKIFTKFALNLPNKERVAAKADLRNMTHKVMVTAVLERYEAGELDTQEPKKLTYCWPYDNLEFPYDWDDDNDEDAWLVDIAENHGAILNRETLLATNRCDI